MFQKLLLALMIGGLTACSTNFQAVPTNYTAQNISQTNSPIEKKYSQMGQFAVANQEFASNEKEYAHYKIWYPQNMQTGKTYPLVIMANGTGIEYQKYEEIFTHLASWGFIVAGNDDKSSMFGKSTDNTLNFVLQLNQNKNSVLYQKVNTAQIGVGGHSQGGMGAVSGVVYYPNGKLYRSVFTASSGHDEAYKMNIPYFMVAGTGTVDEKWLAKPEKLLSHFNNMKNNGLTVLARRKNADHGQMLYTADGYMTAWFLYTLTGDKQAGQAFIGNAEIQHNPNWQDVKIKQ